ncbi:EAL domain-containing response regulator [Ferrovibrio sp.]|uniref:EAL domain-containing response regulator n=1 Tax=Ferrovibrio sp. TaxID=1917215 RepID=UPI0025BDD952|nr:EAL domain-containing response regulator [Ferrovibrio sp.]MBX3454815.1 EAL domain-containing response regulator [Ferrovibrio sp.]
MGKAVRGLSQHRFSTGNIALEPAADHIAKLHVMVVDDIKLMRDVATALLQRCGVHRITSHADGELALAALDNLATENNPVDLILLDLNMPVMDGIEVLRHLGARRFAGQVALVSAENIRVLRTAETLARAHNLDIVGYVEKPLTAEGLNAILGKTGQKRQRAEASVDEAPTEAELLDAIRDGQIQIAVQPKVDMRSRTVLGVEALARWRHPLRGTIMPGRFVPVAESGAAADPLFHTVLSQSLRAAARWRALGFNLKVAVNMSTANLGSLNLPDRLSLATREAGLPPDSLILEVTESRLIEDLAAALEVLTRLRLKGFGLSIDDFGTGYSSLEQLQRIPFEELKIDRQFVVAAADDQAARAIMASSIRLARQLGMSTVAEGVERQEDWDCAQLLGCDLAQGYLLAEPMPPEQLPNWVAAWNSGRNSTEA